MKIFKTFVLFIFLFCALFNQKHLVLAVPNENIGDIYIVYDEENNIVFENNMVEVGDKIISCDFKEYEIISVNHENQTALAEFTGYYIAPKIKNYSKGLNFSNVLPDKSVGIYMTHNDESYVPSDGYSSVYGKGGIHDVARALKEEFEELGYRVYFDETLHLPHNSSAYSRSSVTAKNLLDKNPDALFDIHRDGVSRSVYVKTVDGKERCKVRIVVGQANPNKDANLQFAMYLISVAKEYCPWLFLDIYYAKGTYNQNLTNKGLLFEMGTYLAEKELAIEATQFLAKIVDKTLFSTVVEENNNLLISDENIDPVTDNLVNNVLESPQNFNYTSKYVRNIVIFTSSVVFVLLFCFCFAVYKKRKLHNKNTNNPRPH